MTAKKYERVIEIARALDKIFAEDTTTDISNLDTSTTDELVDELHALLAELPEDEPIFVLRAQDSAAPKAVKAWVHFATDVGADGPTIGSGVRTEAEMIKWQERYPLKVRVPTTPPPIE
jgi:hypothetical protein